MHENSDSSSTDTGPNGTANVSPNGTTDMGPNVSPDVSTDTGKQAGDTTLRDLFPRGMIQPEGSFRFSMDALLLASFAMEFVRGKRNQRIADLGAGCGVIGLGMLLDAQQVAKGTMDVTGIERVPELAEAAMQNAARLGMADRYVCINGDLAEIRLLANGGVAGSDISPEERAGVASGEHSGEGFGPTSELKSEPMVPLSCDVTTGAAHDHGNILTPDQQAGRSVNAKLVEPSVRKALQDLLRNESYDAVVANPPYRRADQGRLSQSAMRTDALFETTGSLTVFLSAARFLLKNSKRFFCIYPAERVAELMAGLVDTGLEPKRMRCIHSKSDRDAVLVLMESVKNGNRGITVEPPLFLYDGEGEETRLTEAALEYCPWLACNAGGRNNHP